MTTSNMTKTLCLFLTLLLSCKSELKVKSDEKEPIVTQDPKTSKDQSKSETKSEPKKEPAPNSDSNQASLTVVIENLKTTSLLSDELRISWEADGETKGFFVAAVEGDGNEGDCSTSGISLGVNEREHTFTGLDVNKTYTLHVCSQLKPAVMQSLSATTLKSIPNIPLYSNAPNWNSYIRNDGTGLHDATNVACDGTETGKQLDQLCLHGAELRKSASAELGASCNGITAYDMLSAFEWACDDGSGAAVIYSNGLNEDKGLKDLVTESAFKSNRLIVEKDGVQMFSSASEVWWANEVKALPEGAADLDAANTVYTLGTSRVDGTHEIKADGISFVTLGDARLTGASNVLKSTTARKFLWIEGRFGSSAVTPIDLKNASFMQARGLDITEMSAGSGFSCNTCNYYKMEKLRIERTPPAVVCGGTVCSGIEIATSTYFEVDDLKVRHFENGIKIAASMFGEVKNIRGYRNLTHIVAGGSQAVNFKHINLRFGATGISGPYASKFYNLHISNMSYACLTDSSFMSQAYIVNSSFINCSFGFYGGAFSDIITFLNTSFINNDQDSFHNSRGEHIDFVNSNFENAGEIYMAHADANLNVFVQTAINDTDYTTLTDVHDISFLDGLLMGGSISCSNISSGANPGLDGTCTPTGGSTSVPLTGLDMSTSYKLDVPGAEVVSYSLASDQTDEENPFLVYGKHDDSRLGCVTGFDCKLYDWRLSAGASVIRNTTNDGSNQNSAFIAGQSCPNAVNGNRTITDSFGTPNEFLINAFEIVEDSIGDDDGLCEDNEACIYSPNFGSYQGEGDYLANGTCIFQDGNVSGVTMYAYPINGI